jgi:hypothetical protein
VGERADGGAAGAEAEAEVERGGSDGEEAVEAEAEAEVEEGGTEGVLLLGDPGVIIVRETSRRDSCRCWPRSGIRETACEFSKRDCYDEHSYRTENQPFN